MYPRDICRPMYKIYNVFRVHFSLIMYVCICWLERTKKYTKYQIHMTRSPHDLIFLKKSLLFLYRWCDVFYVFFQGRSQDLGMGGGGQEFFFQIWKFACRFFARGFEGMLT